MKIYKLKISGWGDSDEESFYLHKENAIQAGVNYLKKFYNISDEDIEIRDRNLDIYILKKNSYFIDVEIEVINTEDEL